MASNSSYLGQAICINKKITEIISLNCRYPSYLEITNLRKSGGVMILETADIEHLMEMSLI